MLSKYCQLGQCNGYVIVTNVLDGMDEWHQFVQVPINYMTCHFSLWNLSVLSPKLSHTISMAVVGWADIKKLHFSKYNIFKWSPQYCDRCQTTRLLIWRVTSFWWNQCVVRSATQQHRLEVTQESQLHCFTSDNPCEQSFVTSLQNTILACQQHCPTAPCTTRWHRDGFGGSKNLRTRMVWSLIWFASTMELLTSWTVETSHSSSAMTSRLWG